ncbi:hypothetical protein K440DRAFT_642149 [Wilcoxina mikolae CBS 423.85]|nr:hypothetical protein K440DRAFT_642149 [Wilcoxina mikolae CBS 423.85]
MTITYFCTTTLSGTIDTIAARGYEVFRTISPAHSCIRSTTTATTSRIVTYLSTTSIARTIDTAGTRGYTALYAASSKTNSPSGTSNKKRTKALVAVIVMCLTRCALIKRVGRGKSISIMIVTGQRSELGGARGMFGGA